MQTNGRLTKSDDPIDWLDPFSKIELEMIQPLLGLKKNAKLLVLDVGCGNGYRSSFFNNNPNVTLFGIDINLAQLSTARSRESSIGKFINGDIERMPFKDSSFDIIFSYSVLQYVDWRIVVSNCHNLLKPGGTAVFIENLEGNPISKVYRAIHKYFGWKYPLHQTPQKYINIRELGWFGNNFNITKARTVHLFSPLVLISSSIKKGFSGTPMRVPSKKLFRMLSKLDNCLIKKMPILQAYCWHLVICLKKDAK